MFKLLTLKILLLFVICFITSCSIFSPESANEFTVTKKSPLLIPPNMDIVPPGKKRDKAESSVKKSTSNKSEFSLEEILTGQSATKKPYVKKTKINLSKKKNLVRSILRMKELTTLE